MVSGRKTNRCGTHAGYQRHRREGTAPCADCRRAQRDYMRTYRQDPEKLRVALQGNYARERALWRLARLHPTEFQMLVDEERENGA